MRLMLARGQSRWIGPHLAVLILAACLACTQPADPSGRLTRGEWVPLGLSGRWVNALFLRGDTLYAATDSGTYRTLLGAPDPIWAPLGPVGDTVIAVMPLDGDTLLAAVSISGVPPDTLSLLRTTDGGESWHPFQNGFGRGGGSNAVFAFARLPQVPRTLFATSVNALIARSDDGGASWRAIWGDWKNGAAGTHFIAVDPRHPTFILAGGEGGIFAPFLVKSLDAGETWEGFNPSTGGDDAIYRAAVDPTRVDIVYAGLEGHVMRSTDGGRTWHDALGVGVYFEGLATSRIAPARLYAAGRKNGPASLEQPLVVHMSEDRGDTWIPFTQEVVRLGGVWDLVLRTDGAGEVAILATADGVFQFRATR